MILDTGQIISVAAIVLPLLAFVLFELVRGSSGAPRRYYLRFLTFGCMHGLILWVLFVWGNWHGAPDSSVGLMATFGLFLAGALGACLTFSAGYLASALLLDVSRRLVRRARGRSGSLSKR